MSNIQAVSDFEARSEEDQDSWHASSSRTFYFLGRGFVRLSALGLFIAALTAYGMQPEPQLLRGLLPYWTQIALLTAVVVVAYLAPRLTVLLGAALLAAYFQMFSVPVLAAATLFFLTTNAITALLLAEQLLIGVLAGLRTGKGEKTALCSVLFFSIVFLQGFLLLGFRSYTSTALLSFSVLILFVVLLACRKALVQLLSSFQRRVVNPLSEPDSATSDFLWALCCLFVLFAAWMYVYPGALTIDANKGYLAIAKFYVRTNSLLLLDPAWTIMNMKAFPHVQEIVLSTGFLLSGNVGAKLLALLIVVAKLQMIFFLARATLGFSKVRAYAGVLLFAVSPIILELHSVVRPENLLTVYSLFMLFAFERALRLMDDGLDAQALRAAACAAVSALLICSLKYTAFFLLLACAAVYWRLVRFALYHLRELFRVAWLPIALAAVIAAFWYVRNLLLWGEVVSMTPYGKYHLTVHFPPLRSLSEIWQFLTSAFVRSNAYTEFPDFAYGLLGFVLIPALLVGLTAHPGLRRFSGVALLYGVLLLASSRQIRYLAVVLPIAYLALATLPAVLPIPGTRQFRAEWGKPLCGAIAVVLLVVALKVSSYIEAVVGHGVRARLSLQDVDFSDVTSTLQELNAAAPYPSLVMTSQWDVNYELDARVFRADPIQSLARIKELFALYDFSHFLVGEHVAFDVHNLIFNDLEFLRAFSRGDVQAGMTHLLPIDHRRFDELFRYIEDKGWPLDQTLIVSAQHMERNPFHIVPGDRVGLPGLPYPLYRAAGLWDGRGYRPFSDTETFQAGEPLGYYFEDQPASSHLGKRNLAVEQREEGLEELSAPFGLPASVVAGDTGVGSRKYRLAVPKGAQQGPVVVEVWLRARRMAAADKIVVRVDGTEQETSPFDALLKWHKAAERSFQHGVGDELDVDVQLQTAGRINLTALRDVRIVLRRPHQRYFLPDVPPMARAAGSELDYREPALFIYEDFFSPLRHSPGLVFQTERESVEVGSAHQMRLSSESGSGYKKYRLSFPNDLQSQLRLTVAVNSLRAGSDSTVTLIARSRHFGEQKTVQRQFSELQTGNHWQELLQIDFSRNSTSPPKPASDLEIEFHLSAPLPEDRQAAELGALLIQVGSPLS